MTATDTTEATHRGTIPTPFGTIVIGPQVGRWRRDRWISRTGHEEAAPVFSCGPADRTAHHDTQTAYNAACSCCWLGIGHTEAEHAAQITRGTATPENAGTRY